MQVHRCLTLLLLKVHGIIFEVWDNNITKKI
jgi:hypothetical protein